MIVVHIQNSETPEKEPKKLSKYKDPAYFDFMLRTVIREYNEKSRKN